MALLSSFDKKLVEAGCDEAGRGCLAGPVVAAAVILPKKYKNKFLDDSKKLTEKQRYELREQIQADAIEWAYAIVDNVKIDEINILNASFLAMHHALDKLTTSPELLLIDGNRFKKYKEIRHECIIKGDGKYLSIAAASILAKTYRDDIMLELHEKFPHYKWNQNKGYPTRDHRTGIEQFGPTPLHRMTFTLLPDQLELDFSTPEV